MQLALEQAAESVRKGAGPFGAVVARNGELIAATHNHVTLHNDPTAHAEICAIREASQKLGSFDLSGCELYTSCEPCPMCMGAAYWARFDKVYYANSRYDAAKAGFDDEFIYTELAKDIDQRSLPMQHIALPDATKAFTLWTELESKTPY